MSTARLDHNPNAGITFITLASSVSQPIHTMIGEVMHPTANALQVAHVPSYLLLQRLAEKIGMRELARKAQGTAKRAGYVTRVVQYVRQGGAR